MPDVPHRTGLILGIETSCDETAAAVVRHGTKTLSNVVASQIALHANYGGVVPELASREHLRNIVPVVRAAIVEAAKSQAGLSLEHLEAIAVTQGPGLAGALLVGITYAKALALTLGKPLIAVNHLEGHIHAVLMDHAQDLIPVNSTETSPSPAAPILALVVSGGHTHLYLASRSAGQGRPWRYRNVGRTVDDAAGEAFDKVAKLLGLGYPGGPWIDHLAPFGDPRAIAFNFSPIKPRSTSRASLSAPISQADSVRESDPRFDLSFSGIKSAVLRYTQSHGMQPAIDRPRPVIHDLSPGTAIIAKLIADHALDQQTLDLLASFQHAVVGNLLKQTFAAARHFGAHSILVSGGVAANSELRRRFTAEAGLRQLPIAFPSIALSTDNAAMIAAAAWPKLLAKDFASDDLTATPQLRLDSPVSANKPVS